MPGRPTAVGDVVDGRFAVEISPGWYRVRGSARDDSGAGELCDEVEVEVKADEITSVEFICP